LPGVHLASCSSSAVRLRRCASSASTKTPRSSLLSVTARASSSLAAFAAARRRTVGQVMRADAVDQVMRAVHARARQSAVHCARADGMHAPLLARIRASAALPSSSLVLLLVEPPVLTWASTPDPAACAAAVRPRRGTAAAASTDGRPCTDLTIAHALKHDAHGRSAATATALRMRPITRFFALNLSTKLLQRTRVGGLWLHHTKSRRWKNLLSPP